MLSLFWETFPVLAQLTNSAAQPTAILVRKRRIVGFIGSECVLLTNSLRFCNAGVEERQKK